MNRPFIASLVLILVACTVGIAAQHITEHPPHVAPPAAEVTAPPPLAAVGGDSEEAATDLIVAFGEGVRREQERIAADEMAALEAARPRSGSGSVATGSYEGAGDCTGFAIPDHIIQRESRGNPYAVNSSSGAFGCAQVMPMHWNPGGACAGLDRYSIDDQRTCVEWLSEGGTRLSPWAG